MFSSPGSNVYLQQVINIGQYNGSVRTEAEG